MALVTGAASGIGLAAARRFAGLGMTLVMVDLGGEALERASVEVAEITESEVFAAAADVSRPEQLEQLRAQVEERFGALTVLMNNAAVGDNPGLPWENAAAWQKLVAVNLWGVVHGVQAFLPGMLASGQPGMVINTGSKQGITSPPGNYAYNLSKAALRNYSESLAHALRVACGSRITAHLLIPGFTHTGMTGVAEKPADAWTAEQVVDFMLERVGAGDFYVLCPDNAVDRATDERRMRWAMDDIILNRPALSRWHPDYEAEFARFVAKR
ncbi:MAG TPA: SDR family NAD(P)-dependent oxidoreductase [Polyangiaceae bacterium]|nr:SDR family NAD(P)-dependent oxidoreductase [Polyangiaceae bacterium]